MSKLAIDSNSAPIQAVKPTVATNVATSTYTHTAPSGVVRLVSAAGATYAFDGTADIELPAGVIEYVRINNGDVITTSGTINITSCE